jgi:hypothetical protein
MDPAFDMPAMNWGQQGSFQKPVSPPIDGPADGTLVQLPCINQDWVLLLMGAAEQLRNPSSWDAALSDSARDLVLSRVTQLQEMIWSAMDNPCCNVAMRLTAGCVLQFSTDGGSTYHDVTDWAANFDTCVKAAIPPVPPPNPAGNTHNQQACNLAGYIATAFLQECVSVAHTALAAGNNVLQYFQQLAADIATGNPFLEVLVTVADDLYPTVQAQPITDVAAVAGDPALWSQVTCVIYNCIKTVGYLDASNFACVGTGLAGLAYSKAWVPPMLSRAWTDTGLLFLQQFDSPGGIDDVDCSGCAEWCTQQDFTVSAGAWFISGPFGNYTAGVGFESTYDAPNTECRIQIAWGPNPIPAATMSAVEFFVTTPSGYTSGKPWQPGYAVYRSGSLKATGFFTPVPGPGVVKYTAAFAAQVIDQILLEWANDGAVGVVISKAAVTGPGANPFGTSNCTP